jgi:hypothetical protein
MTAKQMAANRARKSENFGWFLEALARKLQYQGKSPAEIRIAIKEQKERRAKC